MSGIGASGNSPSAADLALAMLAAAADPETHRARLDELQKRQDEAQDAIDEHNATLALIEQKHSDVEAAHAQLSEARAAFTTEQVKHEADMKAREDAVARAHEELGTRETATAAAEAALAERGRAVAAKEAALANREKSIAEREAAITERENEARSLKTDYQAKLAALNAIVRGKE